jgi:hypothetical protein
MKKVLFFALLWEGKRDLLESTNMDFMRPRNEPTLTMLSMEISTESIYRSKYLCRSGCIRVSNVSSAYVGMQSSTAVLHWGNDVAYMPRHHLPRFDELSGLDTHLASGLCAGRTQSTYVYSTEIWLTSSVCNRGEYGGECAGQEVRGK